MFKWILEQYVLLEKFRSANRKKKEFKKKNLMKSY